jgi:prepilin peptidase CpaA
MTLSMIAALVASVLFSACMIGAGLMDLLTMRIRNVLVGTLLVAYPVFATLVGFDFGTLAASAAVAVAVFAGAFAFFAFGLIGGGDAKLAVASVLWLGPGHAGPYLFYTALFGGLFALVLLQFRLLPLMEGWRESPWISRLHRRETGIPYGVPMAASALMILPDTAWIAVLR